MNEIIKELTLEQIFADYELGHAIATDINLPYKRHTDAIKWLKESVEQFLLIKLKERDDKLSAIRGVLDSEIDDWNKLIFIKDLIK